MSWGPSPEYADWWYVVSWRGLIWAGVATALSASAAVLFTLVQFWSDDIRDKRAAAQHRALEAQTANANREAATAAQRVAELETESARLKAQAEADRLARVKIEEKLAPRSLSADQKLAIVKAVAPFAPLAYEFVSYQEDPEVVQLVHSLVWVLQAAGWKGQPATGFLLAQLETGVRVEFAASKEGEYAPAARALAEALNANGIAATFGAREKLEVTDRVKIRVGKKP